ncbi:hypothetical protein IWX48DRAFT_670636 [Phyllosticta citricarpa]
MSCNTRLSSEVEIATQRRNLDQAAELQESGRSLEQQQTSSNRFSNVSPTAQWSDSDLELENIHSNGTSLQSKAGGSSRHGAPTAITRESKEPSLYRQCAACLEEKRYYECARAPCDHNYCADCIDHLFLDAVKDESLYPPRCCRTEIPLSSVRNFLSLRTESDFMKKAPEWEAKDRTYCARPVCSAWIPRHRIQSDIGDCPSCRAKTCTICKAGAHDDGDCLEDEATQQLLELAQENKWQRCYQCRRLVSLSAGCYHMTCLCRAQWCYLCRAAWKTCSCREADEENIWQRAENGMHRERWEEFAYAANAFFQTLNDRLRQNQDCLHDQWSYIRGAHRGETCNYQMPNYIFECQQCLLRSCSRCRRNRL